MADIFEVLSNINAKNGCWYDQQPDDVKKTVQPYVIQRWATGTTSPLQIVLINEFVNPYTFTLQAERELIWKLLTACSVGKQLRYKWVKPKGKDASYPLSVQLIQAKYKYSKQQCQDVIPLIGHDELINIAMDLGWESDKMSKLRRECKDMGPEMAPSPVNDALVYD